MPDLLEATGLTKTFKGFAALDGVDFSLREAEVHALLGENGAGKSTLINLISGTLPWTSGTCRIFGEPVPRLTPALARRMGIAAVFQEFSVAPDLTVLENLFLGDEEAGPLFLRHRAMRKAAARLLDDLRFELPLDTRVVHLSRAQRQMVEIAKAMRREPRILILDEPTASLTDGEAAKLFEAMSVLRARKVGLLYVSHRMSEIRALSDRVTVLRGGRHIDTVATAEVSDTALIEMMVGRSMDEMFPTVRSTPAAVRLAVEGLSTAEGTVEGASFTARAGEVVGIGGLVGCGRSELLRAVFGLNRIAEGRIRLGEATVERPTPRRMLKAGVCYFPADRGAEGLATGRPVRENVTMNALNRPEVSSGPVLRIWRERSIVRKPLVSLGLRPMEPEWRISSFSGGNQQKVMLARGLLRDFDVYLFDEPTVGIDVGAKRDVYNLIRDLAEAGACVVISSSELPELINLASRIYVMHAGRIMTEASGDQLTEAQLLPHFFGEAGGHDTAGAEAPGAGAERQGAAS